MQRRIQVSGCWKKTENVKTETPVENAGVKLVNVLDQNYFADAHIPGSLNITLDALEDASKDWNKDANIVVYCADYKCSASSAAARKLAALGFTNVKAYEAGMAGWAQAGFPVEGPAQEAYLTQPNEKLEHVEHTDEENETDAVKTEQQDVTEITTTELANELGVQTNS